VSWIGSAWRTLKHSWNAIQAVENQPDQFQYMGPSYSFRPDRTRLRFSNEKSLTSAIYTRLSIDIAAVDMRHVKVDDNNRYLDDVQSGLMNALQFEANIDQGPRALKQDIVLTMFDKGVVAIVPVDTTTDPRMPGSWDIQTLRVGEVVAWYPRHVTVRLYDDRSGIKKDITLPKSMVAIVENPLYTVMNETNSTLQRLVRKLNLLDVVDEQSASGKLDLIIQLPYVIKSDTRREQAEQRRKDIEVQLKGSQYGIAYTDGTEKITQLNRPAENNLMDQITYLTNMLYGQLGLTEEVLNGTADEKTMVNYYNRSIEPILSAIAEALQRTFLTKTARTQGQRVMFFNNPFKYMTSATLAEMADKLTRNEILSSNDMRALIGMKPSKTPGADELRNKNLPITTDPAPGTTAPATQRISDTNGSPPPDSSADGGTGDSQNGTGP
jgi:Phage portal protein